MSTDATPCWALRHRGQWDGPSSTWMVLWLTGDPVESVTHEVTHAFSLAERGEAQAWAASYLAEQHGVAVASWTPVPYPPQYFAPEELEWLGPSYWRAVLAV